MLTNEPYCKVSPITF